MQSLAILFLLLLDILFIYFCDSWSFRLLILDSLNYVAGLSLRSCGLGLNGLGLPSSREFGPVYKTALRMTNRVL